MDGQSLNQQPEISDLRGSLDELDSAIVRLIAQRREVITAVAKAKERGAAAIADAEREQHIIESVQAQATELGVSPNLVRRIFRELLNDSIALQTSHLKGGSGGDSGARARIAFQGVTHAYSYQAAQKYLNSYGIEGDLTGYHTFREAAAALLSGDADLAILPIENTTAGSINEVYALLREHELFIVGEETWKVEHCLAAIADIPLSGLSKILSHPQGLEQCAQLLSSLPNATAVPSFDTAGAMQAVAESGDPSIAAIGSLEAAAEYGLVVLRRNISDSSDNYTRFVVLSRSATPVDLRIPCKTSTILVTRHEEGALLRCLEILSGSGHSMTKLESRPRPGMPWEYLFFVDFEGNAADPRTVAALDELRSAALYIKVLGSYPAKVLREPARTGELPAPGPGRRGDAGGGGARLRLRAGPVTTSWSTGPPARPTPWCASVTCWSAATGSWSWPDRARSRARLRSTRRPAWSATTARTCCAAACSSPVRRRTRSRVWAGTGSICWSRPAGRPGCRS